MDEMMALALEQARRGRGSVAPNPLVGAVIVRDGVVLATGYHAQAGALHAETAALAACEDPKGATMYVTLEPCRHVGRQPPCVDAIVASGISRVVVGALDPNPVTNAGGVRTLRDAGIEVDVLDDPACRRLVEDFAVWIEGARPYLALKMAMSLDGAITSRPGVREQLTGEPAMRYVRELRVEHDAVMVGAGTVRVDDPLLTVRPPHPRARRYVRVVACETDPVPEGSRIFEPLEGYAKTIVLAPGGARERFAELTGVAEVLFVGGNARTQLDLAAAMRALREREVYSVLCEGGPTLGARLLAAGLVDRLYWAIAPRLLSNERALPVLAGADLAASRRKVRFDSIEQVGEDAILSGRVDV